MAAVNIGKFQIQMDINLIVGFVAALACVGASAEVFAVETWIAGSYVPSPEADVEAFFGMRRMMSWKSVLQFVMLR